MAKVFKTEKEVVKAIKTIAKKQDIHPLQVKQKHLIDAGVSTYEVSKLGGLQEIHENNFDLLTIRNGQKIDKSKKTFLVTSYSYGTNVNRDFFFALKKYCSVNNAQLIIQFLKNGAETFIDPILKDEVFVTKDIYLNDNIRISSIENKASSYSAPTGLTRVSTRGVSSVVGGNFISMNYVPLSRNKLPHFIATPGSINDSNARVDLASKSEYLASLDHTLGAFLIEIESNKFFHQRHIKFNTAGNYFVDMGKKYSKKAVSVFNPSHLVLGDWHSGHTDLKAAQIWLDLTKKLNIGTWVMHDVFDGSSINHHEMYNTTKRAQKAVEGLLSLKDELDYFTKDIIGLSNKVKNIVVVKSNHDEFLNRYLNEMRYKDEPQNLSFALKLHSAMIDEGIDPLHYGFNLLNKLPKNVKWLSREDSYKVGGVELAAHGDRGANGMKRGSAKTFEDAYGPCIVGHSHTPQIAREVFIVGTTTAPFPDYGDGPGSWVQTSCILYPDGSRQLLNIMNEKVTTKKV